MNKQLLLLLLGMTQQLPHQGCLANFICTRMHSTNEKLCILAKFVQQLTHVSHDRAQLMASVLSAIITLETNYQASHTGNQ
jgi:hypothetical protein